MSSVTVSDESSVDLGSVTLKRIGFFCFPIKHSTHTWEIRFGFQSDLVFGTKLTENQIGFPFSFPKIQCLRTAVVKTVS